MADTDTTVAGWRRWARLAFVLVAWVFTGCVAVQVFLAGLAIFVDPLNWVQHTRFVHVFEPLPLVLIGLAVAGRLPARLLWLSAALFGLIFLQYATANIKGLVGALHPVNALLLFWLSVALATRSWALISRHATPTVAIPTRATSGL